MNQSFDTVIIGAGQAGLAASYCLKQHGCEHAVLEQAALPGSVWRDDRWDSFTLVTPNWAIRMPGAEYDGDDPDGYLPRDEIVSYFARYVARFDLPVQFDTRVASVEQKPGGKGYRVAANETLIEAANVVVATGLFQRPKIPAFGINLPSSIVQLPSGRYRNPQGLPPGAVLVVGSAQSGCQIAEELYQSGRKVFLCVGSAGRAPRRYRGRDTVEWLHITGFLDRTVDRLPSPRARFAGNPHVSGRSGGRTLNLHQFARDGVTLLGRLVGAQDGKIALAGDLKENLAKADRFEVELVKMIDGYIERTGLAAPQETLPELRDGYAVDEIRELDLRAAGVGAVIWAMGYTFDFSLVKLPVTDGEGFPVSQSGVTQYPGLYFVGLPWQPMQKTGLLVGVGEHAMHIASAIAARGR